MVLSRRPGTLRRLGALALLPLVVVLDVGLDDAQRNAPVRHFWLLAAVAAQLMFWTLAWSMERARQRRAAMQAVARRRPLTRAREKSRRRMEALLECVTDGFFCLDSDLRFTLVNGRAAARFGATPAQLLGAPAAELLRSVGGAVYAARVREVLASRKAAQFEIVDGAERRYDEVNALPFLEDGVAIHFRDVTARKRGERAEHLLSRAGLQLVQSLDEGTMLPRLLAIALEELGEYAVVALLDEHEELDQVATAGGGLAEQRAHRETAVVDSRYELGAPAGLAEVLRSGEAQLAPDLCPRLSATFSEHPELAEQWARADLGPFLAVPLRARDRPLGAMAFYSSRGRPFDPADLELAQELANQTAMAIDNAHLYRRAQRESQLREEVLSLVSHDLKNPIGSILASSSLVRTLLEQLDSDPRLLSAARRIDLSARTTLRLIRDLNDYASISAGALSIELGAHSTAGILEEALGLLEPIANERHIQLHAEPLESPSWLLCDRGRVLQILSNLIGNAIKFSPDHGVVTVSAHPAGKHLRFSVADHGPGIPPELLGRVFERYWKANRRDGRGLGLGLFIVQHLVEAHGGSAWVESQVGLGTVFHFTVPLHEAVTAPRELLPLSREGSLETRP